MDLRSSLVICLLMVCFMRPVHGQPVSGENPLRILYDSLFQTGRHIINGKLYHPVHRPGTGHPYFGSVSWTAGIICNEKASIPCRAIRYDLVNDDLLIQHFSVTGSYVIAVNPDIVGSFLLGDHKFYRLESLKAADFDFEPGYFELAYEGKTDVWIKWQKSYSERPSGSGEYMQTRTVFLKTGDSFHRITSRRSLLRALQDRKDEMRAYIKQHGLAVGRAGLDEIISLVRYYDEEH